MVLAVVAAVGMYFFVPIPIIVTNTIARFMSIPFAWVSIVIIILTYGIGRFVRDKYYMSFGFGGDVIIALLFGAFWSTIALFIQFSLQLM